MNGIFYTVATPIGNLADISQRAIETLKNVDLILCEDTRTSKVLLDRYEIFTELKSYHKFNEQARCGEILEMLENGKNIALITDAGTPCISDPGSILIDELYKNEIKVTPIPGASAVVTFLSALPREKEEFVFVGFLPRKQEEQKQLLEKYFATNIVFYESPKRLVKTLENIKLFFGENAKIAIGRELTKKFEEIKVDTVQSFIEKFSNNEPKGEIVGLVYAQKEEEQDLSLIKTQIQKLKEKDFSNKDISLILSTLFDCKKNLVYSIAMSMKVEKDQQ